MLTVMTRVELVVGRTAQRAGKRRKGGTARDTSSPAGVLVRGFTRQVADAVEATIVARTRDLVQKAGTPAYLAPGRHADAPVGERWPTLDEHQWTYIRRVLARTGGNKSEAANILGLHRRSLQRLLANARVRSARKKSRARGRPGDLSRPPAASQQVVTGDGTIVLEQLTFEQIEGAVLLWALRRSAGDQESAARSLGIARRTFTQRISRYAKTRARKGRSARN
jgi:DNA-binding NtrC family response regulator